MKLIITSFLIFFGTYLNAQTARYQLEKNVVDFGEPTCGEVKKTIKTTNLTTEKLPISAYVGSNFRTAVGWCSVVLPMMPIFNVNDFVKHTETGEVYRIIEVTEGEYQFFFKLETVEKITIETPSPESILETII